MLMFDWLVPSSCDMAVKCETLWKIAAGFSTNQHPFNILPPSARRAMCRALLLAGSAYFEDGRKTAYMQLVS